MNMIAEKNNVDNISTNKHSIISYISLGSNMGVPEENLAVACDKLQSTQFTNELFGKEPLRIDAYSQIYLTEPQNIKDQPFFANQVIKLSCVSEITPSMLLHRLLDIENEMGRVRSLRFGPRIIDLDLLFIEGVQMNTSELILPHPRMCERAFVLVPLGEVANDLVFYNGTSVGEALQALSFRVEENVIYQE